MRHVIFCLLATVLLTSPAFADKLITIKPTHDKGMIHLEMRVPLSARASMPVLQLLRLEGDKIIPMRALLQPEIQRSDAGQRGMVMLTAQAAIDDAWMATEDQQAYAVTATVDGKVVAAGSVNLVFAGGLLYWLRPVILPKNSETMELSGCASRSEVQFADTAMLAATSPSTQSHGSIYEPLDREPHEGGGDTVGDRICMQHTSVVGAGGGQIISEVTSASCVSGWDGYCSASTCSNSIGTLHKSVDPLVLIGG